MFRDEKQASGSRSLTCTNGVHVAGGNWHGQSWCRVIVLPSAERREEQEVPHRDLLVLVRAQASGRHRLQPSVRHTHLDGRHHPLRPGGRDTYIHGTVATSTPSPAGSPFDASGNSTASRTRRRGSNRHRRSSLVHVQRRDRGVASAHRVDLTHDQPPRTPGVR